MQDLHHQQEHPWPTILYLNLNRHRDPDATNLTVALLHEPGSKLFRSRLSRDYMESLLKGYKAVYKEC